eukprot:727557-Hanusia_phi.AAC.1
MADATSTGTKILAVDTNCKGREAQDQWHWSSPFPSSSVAQIAPPTCFMPSSSGPISVIRGVHSNHHFNHSLHTMRGPPFPPAYHPPLNQFKFLQISTTCCRYLSSSLPYQPSHWLSLAILISSSPRHFLSSTPRPLPSSTSRHPLLLSPAPPLLLCC